jgi:myosin heavy subunit
LGLDFGGDEIKFKVSPIANPPPTPMEIIFKFDAPLEDAFPNSDVFENALRATFTEGLKYQDIEEAKRTYHEDQFERIVRDVAATTGTTREAVLKNIAPRLPAYQDALRDIETLKNRSSELSSQLSQVQSDNRKLENELRAQHAEATRLRNANAGLQEKIDSSSKELARIGDELGSARRVMDAYQKGIANLQRSSNLKVDTSKDITTQIADVIQTMRKFQKDNEALSAQITSFRADLQELQSVKAQLTGELEDARTTNRKLRDTIGTLTSKEDSLARQYIQLKNVKENLENVTLAIHNLNSRTVEDKSDAGIRSEKISVFLRNIPIGTLEYRVPEYLSANKEAVADARFSTESIDYVRVTPEERHILRSLGDKLKMQVTLSSPVESMQVSPETTELQQEVGERDYAAWRWKIANHGTRDARVRLELKLVNRNADDIQLLSRERLIQSSSMVRQVRSQLQPIPLAIGTLIGFLLFGIVGIFRRARPHDRGPKRPAHAGTESTPYVGQKRL